MSIVAKRSPISATAEHCYSISLLLSLCIVITSGRFLLHRDAAELSLNAIDQVAWHDG